MHYFQIEPVDGGDRLAAPPPVRTSRRVQVQESQAHRRNCSDGSSTGTLGPENVCLFVMINFSYILVFGQVVLFFYIILYGNYLPF